MKLTWLACLALCGLFMGGCARELECEIDYSKPDMITPPFFWIKNSEVGQVWYDVVVEINYDAPGGGYAFLVKEIQGGDSAFLDARTFAKKSGVRFEWGKRKLNNVRVSVRYPRRKPIIFDLRHEYL